MNLYTTNIAVSQRIKELVGEMDTYLYRHSGKVLRYDELRGRTFSEENPIVPCFTLSELPEVLKKVGEKLGWEVLEYSDRGYTRELYMHYYLKCCELHATTGEESVNNYLLSVLN